MGFNDGIEEFNTARIAYREAVLAARALGLTWIVASAEGIEVWGQKMIGRQVAFLRGHREVSQTALAEAMKARGHQKWSQSTVWAVEKGARPLRLAEAVDVAWVLGVLVDDLVDPHDGEARYQQEIVRAKAELTAVMESIERRLGNLRHDSLVDDVKKAQRRWSARERRNEAGNG